MAIGTSARARVFVHDFLPSCAHSPYLSLFALSSTIFPTNTTTDNHGNRSSSDGVEKIIISVNSSLSKVSIDAAAAASETGTFCGSNTCRTCENNNIGKNPSLVGNDLVCTFVPRSKTYLPAKRTTSFSGSW
jgi:hypothetical protein